MKLRNIGFRLAVTLSMGVIAAIPGVASAHSLGVEVWTDRGNDAVYQPGDVMQVRARVNDDAYLLVYEIDSEGFVHVLFPMRGQGGMVTGRQTYRVPPESADQELVVQNATGQDYIVAIASPQPFEDLPWYLRALDARADDVGYVNQPDDEQGVTSEGRIVGDPFVAMERIRRRIVEHASDPTMFSTAYTMYYVHQQVRYPRYICYDCHRPDRWAWWDGFDPYYSHCSVVDFRVNWSWGWGPSYWCGFVPYYVYLPRTDCPPRWRWGGDNWYSSWDGFRRWNQLWHGPLVRYKSPPPVGYVPPTQYRDWRGGNAPPPPGFVVAGTRRGTGLPIGRDRPDNSGIEARKPDLRPTPSWRPPNEGSRGSEADRGGVRVTRGENPVRRPDVERMPVRRGGDEGERVQRPQPQIRPEGVSRPAPSHEAPRIERQHESQHPREAPARPEPSHESKPRESRGDGRKEGGGF